MPCFPQPTRPAIATHIFTGSWDVTHTNTHSFVHIPRGLQNIFEILDFKFTKVL